LSAPTEPVSVTILDRKYQFSCSAEQRKDLIEAARILDERMMEIRESGRLMSLERIALQAALNLSDEVIKMKREAETREDKIDNRIRSLADELEQALSS
jgi:cell division protein ZapA